MSTVPVCLARYKTRPGLTYHYNHSHKERDTEGYHLPDPEARTYNVNNFLRKSSENVEFSAKMLFFI